MRFEPQLRYRRRWARWIIAAIIVLALLAGVLTWLQSRSQGDPEPSLSPSAAPTRTDAARVANGCLGGPAITAQTVLTAQQQAQLDDVGAAEFAATLTRWTGTSDMALPPADEVPIVLDAITAPDASPSVTDLRDAYDEAGATEERQGEVGSTVDGGYYIESLSEDEVVVSILLFDPEDTRAGERMATSVTYTLDRSSGKWQLVDQQGTRQPSDLTNIMTPFSGGC